MRGTQNPQNLFTKNCVFILTCLNFSHLQSTLHLMQSTYWNIFPLLKIVLNSLILMPFFPGIFLFVCFTSSTLAKRFPLRTFFIWRDKKYVAQDEIGWIGKVEHGNRAVFGGVNRWTLSTVWAGVLVNHPSWNGQMHCKSSKTNLLKPNAPSPGTLT